MTREITGRTVFIITFSAFAVIFAVNFYMAFSAVNTFPGLEVKNSYVASQKFNDQAAAQSALGWTLKAENVDGRFELAITDAEGKPVYPKDLKVRIGRPTIAKDDQEPALYVVGDRYVADTDLYDGKWYAYVEALSRDDVALIQRLEFYVTGGDE